MCTGGVNLRSWLVFKSRSLRPVEWNRTTSLWRGGEREGGKEGGRGGREGGRDRGRDGGRGREGGRERERERKMYI